jgi:regulator of sigma E protease
MMTFSALTVAPDTVWHAIRITWWFLVVLGVLVAFHELGHFLAARWVGVKVLKFSIGFGPKLVGRQVGETEYLVSAIPLGGYVKLFGEEEADAITEEDRQRSFAHKPLLSKMLVVAAGPGFNFLLTYLIYTACLAVGLALPVPTVNDIVSEVEAVLPGSPADLAGIKPGDRIIRVNDREISTNVELLDLIDKSNGKQLALDLRRGDQIKTLLVVPAASPGADHNKPVYRLGIEERAPVITAVMAGSRAMEAGFKEGDRVLRINGHDISTWSQMTELVRDHANQPLQVDVQRATQVVTLAVTPAAEKVTIDGKPAEIGKIGVSAQTRSIIQTSNPLLAPLLGLQATWGWTELTVVGIYKMIVGDISSKNIGGPLTIAKISGEAAEQGASSIIFLIAILSINLGVLNLLPIPILDGGHLLFFAIEGILRKPLGERQRELAQQLGLLLLVGIMIFAFWNDLERLLIR